MLYVSHNSLEDVVDGNSHPTDEEATMFEIFSGFWQIYYFESFFLWNICGACNFPKQSQEFLSNVTNCLIFPEKVIF